MSDSSNRVLHGGLETIFCPISLASIIDQESKLNVCSNENAMNTGMLGVIPGAHGSDHVDERSISRAPSNDPTNRTNSRDDADVIMCICPVCGFSASSPRGQDEHMETEHGECHTGNAVRISATTDSSSPIHGHDSPEISIPSAHTLRASSTPQQQQQQQQQPQYHPVLSGFDHIPCINMVGVHGMGLSVTNNLPYFSGDLNAATTSTNVAQIPIPNLDLEKSSSTLTQDRKSGLEVMKARTYRGSLGRNIRSGSTSGLMDSNSTLANTSVWQKVDSRRRYRCNNCPATFPWHGDLTEHLRLVHGMQKTRESARSGKAGNFCCDHCKYVAKYQSELRRHMRLHWGVKPFVCVFCPYRSAWKGDLKRHMESHHREKFNSESELVEIMSQFKNNAGTTVNGLPLSARSMSDAYNFGSDFESETMDNTSSGQLMEGHDLSSGDVSLTNIPKAVHATNLNLIGTRSSSSILPESLLDSSLTCTVCAYKAQNQSKLQNHMAGHMNLKPFKCPICEHRSNYKWDVRKHLRSQHPGQSDLPVVVLSKMDTPGEDERDTPLNLSPPDSPASLRIDLARKTPEMGFAVNSESTPITEANTIHLWSRQGTCDFDPHAVPIDLSIKEQCNSESKAISEPQSDISTLLPKVPTLSTPLIHHTVSSLVDPKPALLSEIGPTTAGSLAPTYTVPGFSPSTWTSGLGLDQSSMMASSGNNNNTIGLILNIQQQLLMHGLLQTWPSRSISAVVPPASLAPRTSPSCVPGVNKPTLPLEISDISETKQSTFSEYPLVAETIGVPGKTSSEWSSTETDPSDSTQTARSSTGKNATKRAEIHEPAKRTRGRKANATCYTRTGGTSLGSKEEQWKRHQCSGCGHRSNWKWDINKHIKVAHPERTNITTVTLDIEEAKQTFDDYMNRLKLSRNRYLSESVAGSLGTSGSSGGLSWSGNMGAVGEGYYRPFKCSVCGHRSNWKWDVRKHIKQMHNNQAEVITLSLDEARRTIHQYKSCRRQQSRALDTSYKPELQTQFTEPISSAVVANTSTFTSVVTNHGSNVMRAELPTCSMYQSNTIPVTSVHTITMEDQPAVMNEEGQTAGQNNEQSSKGRSYRLYYPCRQCGRTFRSYPTILFHMRHKHHNNLKDVKTSLIPHLSIRFYYAVSRTTSRMRVHRTRMLRDDDKTVAQKSNAPSDGLTARVGKTPGDDHEEGKRIDSCDTTPGSTTRLDGAEASPYQNSERQFVERNTAQRDRILRARRRTYVSPFSAPNQGLTLTGSLPLRPSHDNASGRMIGENHPEPEDISFRKVRRLSGLLDKVLALLEEEALVESEFLESRITREKSGRHIISHLADLIEESVSHNENIQYASPGLDTSANSNEENQPIDHVRSGTHLYSVRPLTEILQHPEIEQRFIRLVTLFRAYRSSHSACSNQSATRLDTHAFTKPENT